ncbi:MAG: polyprenol monophosphomannose synthase [Thermoprotei archaeon]
MLEFYGSFEAKELCVVLPTRNEAENLPILVEKILALGYSIVVVDDESTDGTFELAKRMAEEGKISLIERRGEKGLGTAIRVGIERSPCNFVAVMDADLQHPPEVLPQFLERLRSGCDIVVGSRYTKGGRIEGWPLKRRVISWGAITLAKLFLPEARKSSDPVSGFFAVRKDRVKPEITTSGYKALLDVLVRNPQAKVCDVPYVFRNRESGKSKLGSREIREFWNQVMRLRKERKK